MSDAPTFKDEEDDAPDRFIRRTMPPEIAASQIEAMKAITKISKDARNEQGRYNYATVDQVYDDLRPILAEAGINPISFPVSSKIVARPGRQGDNNWLDAAFDIVVYHKSGALFEAGRHYVSVIFTGPQSSGAAKSFVMKYFLRDWLKIATGDLDADDHDQRGHHEAGMRKTAKNQISSIDERDRRIAEIGKQKTVPDLEAWLAANDDAAGLFPEDIAAVMAEFKKRRKDLREALNTAPTEAKAIPEEAPARLRNAPSSADPY